MEVEEGEGKEKPQQWKPRSIEDLQARYYGLRRTLRDARRKKEQEEALAKGLPPPPPMNITGFDEVRCLGLGWVGLGCWGWMDGHEDGRSRRPPARPPITIAHIHDNPTQQQDGDDFDHPYERKRRRQLALLFTRSKAEELEEYRLREELKAVDAALKRAKKVGGRKGGPMGRGWSWVGGGPPRVCVCASTH